MGWIVLLLVLGLVLLAGWGVVATWLTGGFSDK